MYETCSTTASRQSTSNALINGDAASVAENLKLQLMKILKPHGKDLRTYLERAEYPQSYVRIDEAMKNNSSRKLFDSKEISDFLEGGKMLPLEKVVVLATAMGRTLVVSFDGARSARTRTAQTNLHYSDNRDDFISQLWLNVYAILSTLDYGFDLEKSNIHRLLAEALDTRTFGATNCASIEAVLLAARYHGYELRLLMRRAR